MGGWVTKRKEKRRREESPVLLIRLARRWAQDPNSVMLCYSSSDAARLCIRVGLAVLYLEVADVEDNDRDAA